MPETKLVHMCLDIRGALMNYRPRDYKGMFKRDDGTDMDWREAKHALMDELAKGRSVLPFGECEGFDYQTGCPGHPATAHPKAESVPTVEPNTKEPS